MVFNDTMFNISIMVVFGVWMGILSIVVVRMVRHYNTLTRGITEKTLQEVLTALLQKYDASEATMRTMQQQISLLSKDGTLHLQRIGIVRFNPFSDTGGSQSFTLALLDGQDNGLIMTSLYARTGNRWYIKHIHRGVSEDVELSKEEQQAIKKARPISVQ